MNDARIALGQLLGPYGLKGSIKLKPYSGETDHILALAGSMVDVRKDGVERRLSVKSTKVYGPFVLLDFAGITTPEQVHQLAGYEIWVDRSLGAPLGTDEFYVADLIGAALCFQGETVATVKSVWSNGPTDMLEVVTNDLRTAHIPFSPQFVGQVDQAAKTVELLHRWVLD